MTAVVLNFVDWKRVATNSREVTVLDPPAAIKYLHNRQSMFQDVADLNMSDCYGKVGVPRQLVVTKEPSSIPDAVSKAELSLPLVVKPLVADGSAKSHELSLAFDEVFLSKLDYYSVELPPRPLLENLARELRHRLVR
ncbi:hypothetical protein ZIOFF_026189 [Zingiber officinale]|uniref:inositol-1,3,4-trisphosphate 5/6-kinase n=1 Tax=Zingiber officinale TaxID=94328 RepID=A0A8J5L7A6_ZINOF|nr:hypothetical protein ZIOFF_026189 [Zingiber officinale]